MNICGIQRGKKRNRDVSGIVFAYLKMIYILSNDSHIQKVLYPPYSLEFQSYCPDISQSHIPQNISLLYNDSILSGYVIVFNDDDEIYSFLHFAKIHLDIC